MAAATTTAAAAAGEKRVKPEDVLKHTGPCTGYLCPMAANRFGVEFLEFKIRDAASNRVLFHVRRDPSAPSPAPEDLDDSARFIQYEFPRDFLTLRHVGASLVFKVGDGAPLPSFRMVERHYFRGKLVKSFDFAFGFCIPGSVNEWEVIYEMPRVSPAEVDDMVAHPFETKSDSFYFVGDELIMHNRAEYLYR